MKQICQDPSVFMRDSTMVLREEDFPVLLEEGKSLEFDPMSVQMYSFSSLTKGIGNIKWGDL